MSADEIFIIKSDGQREPFAEAKLRNSLRRSGASEDLIDAAVSRIRSELRDGMTTSHIYRRAFALLKKRHYTVAARYSLKKAIMELGPTGHPFEKLVGAILRSQGYDVEVARTVQGRCVTHEVDVVAVKGERHVMAECKFHNESGAKTDVKVALYVQARFEDVQQAWNAQPGHGEHFDEAWLVTNTKLTLDAIQYARCVGMQAVGWSYPPGGGLGELIERANLQPVTSLISLNKGQKAQLLDAGILLCRDLLEHPGELAVIGMEGARGAKILQEARELCRSGE